MKIHVISSDSFYFYFQKKIYIGRRIPLDHKTLSSETIPTRSAPDSFDWRKKGAISPVKNQGQMGRPAVFATVGLYIANHVVKFKMHQSWYTHEYYLLSL